ncbi:MULTISPECIES: tripartite tricarboxylate transporter substrate-binding protein [unclassified Beijerinckia]|uniref:Bug family tripartite tricarboxylate transporter substrate binding protein n=1 Tax=unclassified Beijerinckia TaxID=2638183 RepID=UPI00089734E4|nr:MULTISPECIES: tripartite tricarboxylate transporter substrate-binding protein [unclassified Beijerinckia]MDH7799571.1 tripartite-type tricarboxylate transporter receptor subunit TctC [Beijerinckia sp. GAS462]SEB46893.1 Tripartite-type tricarboxylate transporter, receptor component TctC [Beijerinckia sp. 28-YEA-48]
MGRFLVAAVSVLSVIVSQAKAQEAVGQFYKGRTITLVVGTSAGGGYDTYARLMARFLSAHVPGAPSVIVSNMPGAGSNVMAAYVAASAVKDGTIIGAPFSTQPLAGILEDVSRLRYDPTRLHYLGSATADLFVCVARPDAPAKTFADTFKAEMAMGGTAETGSTGYLPVLLNNVLGTQFKPVLGYPGSRQIMAAIEKGEVHGMCGINWASLTTQYATLLSEKKIRVIAQENARGVDELDKQGVPRTLEFAKTDEQRAILNIIYAQEVFARPYFVAPEVPRERLAALRQAFLDTWKAPELLTEAKRMGLDVDPTSGEDLQKLLEKIYASPADLLVKTREAIRLKR